MREERNHPGPWKVWRGDVSGWKRPFLFVEWCCEWAVSRLRQWPFIELLELGGRFLILVSAVSFALNYRAVEESQRKAKHYQAWQVIMLASGKAGGGGRADALKDLVEDHVSLARIDLTDADLLGAQLAGANLAGAKLEGANLAGANLAGAKLWDANLAGAQLQNANLTGAGLWDANLRSANLEGATLKDANLAGANLESSNLTDVYLRDADLKGANLQRTRGTRCIKGRSEKGQMMERCWPGEVATSEILPVTDADLVHANLMSAQLAGFKMEDRVQVHALTCSQLKGAKNWKTAFRDELLACGSQIPPSPVPTPGG